MSILEASDFFSFNRISVSNFRGSITRASSYDFGPIPESHGTKHNVAMRKLFTLLTSAACLLAFLTLAPAAPGQSQAAEEKVTALAQQLKLTPQQEVEVLPILMSSLAAEATADTARAARQRRSTATAGGQPHQTTSRGGGSAKHHRQVTKHHAPARKRHA